MALSYNGLRPLQRTAKAARQDPGAAVTEADLLVASTTVVPVENFLARTDSGIPNSSELAYRSTFEVEIRVQNKGATNVYLVWGSWTTDPAAADVAGAPGYSDLPTTFVPPGDVRSFSLSVSSGPFHLITGDGNPDADCTVDRFLRRHHRL